MAHREQNDALKEKNKIAIQRYEFAVKCLGSGKNIIDLGCGMGYGSHLLREAGNHVVGLDSSEEAINYANINYPGVYILGDVNWVGKLDYDSAVCIETICHLKNPQDFMANLSVGELVISAPINPNPNDGYRFRLHNLSEDEFKKLLTGWQIVDELRQKQYLTIYAKKNE